MEQDSKQVQTKPTTSQKADRVSIIAALFAFVVFVVRLFLGRRIRWVIFSILALILLYYYIGHPYKTQSMTMAPAVIAGDRFFVNQSNFLNSQPNRGDVVAYVNDKMDTLVRLGRIFATPGDRIFIDKTHQIFLNGKPQELAAIAEPYRIPPVRSKRFGTIARAKNVPQFFVTTGVKRHKILVAPKLKPFPLAAYFLGEDDYFVLCDFRSECQDSRNFGPIKQHQIEGKVGRIYFSRSDGKINWDRIGMKVE